jgi:hypothetical protein
MDARGGEKKRVNGQGRAEAVAEKALAAVYLRWTSNPILRTPAPRTMSKISTISP